MVGDYRRSYSRSSDDTSSVDEEETTSSMYCAGKEYMSTEWTDEKHSLYLKSMEASFVDQLYSSLGSNLNKDSVPDGLKTSRRFGSSGVKPFEEQFKVLRDGFWQKMNVRQPECRLNGRRHGGGGCGGGCGGGGSREFLRSLWIRHYKHLPKVQSLETDEGSSELENQVVSSNGKKGVVMCSSRESGCSHSRDRDQISIGEEVSDQNFVNEITKDENGSSKKMKTVMSSDQVVPIRKSPENMT